MTAPVNAGLRESLRGHKVGAARVSPDVEMKQLVTDTVTK